MKPYPFIIFIFLLVMTVVIPEIAFCSVESTLGAMQSKLITTILPLASILGIVLASLSFVMGSPNARNNLILAIIGTIIGFAAPSIIAFIRGVVQ